LRLNKDVATSPAHDLFREGKIRSSVFGVICITAALSHFLSGQSIKCVSPTYRTAPETKEKSGWGMAYKIWHFFSGVSLCLKIFATFYAKEAFRMERA